MKNQVRVKHRLRHSMSIIQMLHHTLRHLFSTIMFISVSYSFIGKIITSFDCHSFAIRRNLLSLLLHSEYSTVPFLSVCVCLFVYFFSYLTLCYIELVAAFVLCQDRLTPNFSSYCRSDLALKTFSARQHDGHNPAYRGTKKNPRK